MRALIVTAYYILAEVCLLAATSGDVIISPAERGGLIDKIFYDFKYFNNPSPTDERLREYFVDDGFNGLRTPIYGDDKRPAHPEPGVVIESYYTNHIDAILRARALKPDLIVFASKKLAGKDSFPAWTKDDNGVNPEPYAVLLADYLEFMIGNGIEVDVLGIDNERVFNEGNITPQVHKDIVDALRLLAVERAFAMPQIIGHEDYGPKKNNWMGVLMSNGWGDRLDIYGSHYYPQWRPLNNLKYDLEQAGEREKWHTELHWDAKADQDDFAKAEQAISALWDCTDNGMNGLMWWDYRRTGLRGEMMKRFTVPLLGAYALGTDDLDGADIGTLGKLQTRAFLQGDQLTVYAVNLDESRSYPGMRFRIDRGRIGDSVLARQWTDPGPDEGMESSLEVEFWTSFVFDLPPRSITAFSMAFSEKYAVDTNSIESEIRGAEFVVTYDRDVSDSVGGEPLKSSWSASLEPESWRTDSLSKTILSETLDHQNVELKVPFEGAAVYVRVGDSDL